eukprot:1702746-Prymnesium_polylepis.1
MPRRDDDLAACFNTSAPKFLANSFLLTVRCASPSTNEMASAEYKPDLIRSFGVVWKKRLNSHPSREESF